MDEKGHATAMNVSVDYRVKSTAVSAPRWQQTPSPDKFEHKDLVPKGNPKKQTYLKNLHGKWIDWHLHRPGDQREDWGTRLKPGNSQSGGGRSARPLSHPLDNKARMTQIITEVVLDLDHIDKKEKRVFAKGLYEDFLRTNKNPNTSIHAGLTADVGAARRR